MEPITINTLRTFEALANVPDDQLQWLIDTCEERVLPEGTLFIKPGDPIVGPHFIIDGEFAVFVSQNNSKRELGIFGAGLVTGYLPYSRGKTSTVYMKVRKESRILTFPTERIREMIKDQFELTQALVHVMSNRVREFTAFQQQNEKMMALGKLSAGLTHELNNPASAIVRDSDSLLKHLKMQPGDFKSVIAIRMEPEQVDAVSEILFSILNNRKTLQLTLRQRSDKEDELNDLFDELGIISEMDTVENFVEFGFRPEHVQEFSKHVPKQFLSPVLNWINNLLVTERMVEDIGESAKRIADLVSSVKTFTHMDRAPDKQYADIHIGISNTLTMLGYKLKKGNIALVEEFDETLPPVKALIGELNQVWTNLIDNALDAMETNGKGTLTIKTNKDGKFVQVSIIDDGPGIPADIQSRIFEPFFTTKEMGKGTGLGLEVVQRIVQQQHNGSIKVKSEPGRTEFIVCFPIDG